MGIRSIGRGSSNNYSEELAIFLREKAAQLDASDQELNLLRSGSAPPTMEGSLSTGLFGIGGVLEEELRSDPSYISYYYQNAKWNPRHPHPLLSKEDWQFAQRLQGAVGGGGGSEVGDRRRVSSNDFGGGDSLFSMQPDLGVGKGENKLEVAQQKECSGDGLFVFPGMRLMSKQKRIGGMIQDDTSNTPLVCRPPSCPASHAFENDKSSDSHAANHHEIESLDAFCTGIKAKGASSLQSINPLAPHTYASSLAASLSRTATSDPQLIARAPSPRIPPVGGGMMSSLDRTNVNIPKSFDGVSPNISHSANLVTALSGMSLSASSMVDEGQHPTSQIHHEIDAHQTLFHSRSDLSAIKNSSYLNKSGMMQYYDLAMSSENLLSKGSSMATLNSGGSPLSQYPNNSLNSSLSNNSFGGFATNPSSPSMSGNPLGDGNFPYLVENISTGTVIGSVINSRAMEGGLILGPNLYAAALELQSLGRLGNHSAEHALHMALMDPSYLQYLRSHMELLGLQKPYLEALIQKSQYGLAFGKTGNLNHGFYGDPEFAHGMSYPGSPMGDPVISNLSFRSSSPVRHGEQIMHFPAGLRNIPGCFIGGNLEESFASSLLYEFKSNKTKCFDLAEIAGHVVEFSVDQYGSRFIQQKLEIASVQEKNMVFHEIMPHGLSLMTDVFGNYVIQKFFEHGSASQIRQLAELLTGHVLNLSLQMYGCRVIQKAIEVIELDQQSRIVAELDGHVMRCVRDQNGNHVVQKCIECVPESVIEFIVTTFYYQIVTMSTHPYGCRVVQRVLEHCHKPQTQSMVMDEILQSVFMLAQNQYGNYVIQHVLEHGKPQERSAIINQLIGKIVAMSQQKFASNVIEKCLSFGTPGERQTLVNEILVSTDENEPLQVMMKDQFANYVVQKMLETCDDQQLELILNRIKVHLSALKKYTYGKHIVARVEKLVATGEKRISILSSSSA
ncbi:unnamed protein product [Fraxinus pennsylvanica]|uniref:PUM-HD domain-containing protein n=1 Tax=Fraxinus pennsylvanica TaxID=56036 RepID=A0AAD1ZX50_9LAMI|nr:unnamed protein product [Fraxinus pennsylvanica]